MSSKKIATIVSNDKPLMALFSGAVLGCIALIGLVITAFVWYL